MAALLPIVDLAVLSDPSRPPDQLLLLSQELHKVFTTTGFAYLINPPLSYSHAEVFSLASDLFKLPHETKMSLAKSAFNKHNTNTYRGYFPPQPSHQNNLKEGFEVGCPTVIAGPPSVINKIDLSEPNVWPHPPILPTFRRDLENLHSELQSLSTQLLSLLSISLGKPPDYFTDYLPNSLSTLRLLHYPRQPQTGASKPGSMLCCTPHTDSGLLTLLHQDPTGGLEVYSSAQKKWIQADYLAESIVVNIGDLMAEISEGEFVATLHRVVATAPNPTRPDGNGGLGRISVPFFFEPGEFDVVGGKVYGEHVREKMGEWVEFNHENDIEGRL